MSVKMKYFVAKDKVHTIPNPPNCASTYTGLDKSYDSPPDGYEKCKECFDVPYSRSFPWFDDEGKSTKK